MGSHRVGHDLSDLAAAAAAETRNHITTALEKLLHPCKPLFLHLKSKGNDNVLRSHENVVNEKIDPNQKLLDKHSIVQ